MTPMIDWSVVASNGLFATLFVILFYWTLSQSTKREERMAKRLDTQDVELAHIGEVLSKLTELLELRLEEMRKRLEAEAPRRDRR